MPDTILGASWYTAEQAAAALELPIETVRRFFNAMVADKRVATAYYQGPCEPMLSGYTIMALKGRAQPQQEQAQPKLMVSKRRHARR